jgi:hypothetical protein
LLMIPIITVFVFFRMTDLSKCMLYFYYNCYFPSYPKMLKNLHKAVVYLLQKEVPFPPTY